MSKLVHYWWIIVVIIGLGGLAGLPATLAAPPPLAPAGGLTPTATATASPTPCDPWQPVPGPPVAPGPGIAGDPVSLTDVAALTATDAWAVGHYAGPDNYSRPLAEHWDGRAWAVVPLPASLPPDSFLTRLAVLTAADIWAAGYGSGSGLLIHWDGDAWTVFPIPATPHVDHLYGVAARAPNDVWAVGDSNGGVLMIHWDGAYWQSYTPASGQVLKAVAFLGPNNVIAVGQASRYDEWVQPLVYRWDGNDWTATYPPYSGSRGGGLDNVAVLAPDDIWTVGFNQSSAFYGAYAAHWNGSTWALINPPDHADAFQHGIYAAAPDDIWVVGERGSNRSTRYHWNGSAWSELPPLSGKLRGVAGAGGSLWAVGDGPGVGHILRYAPGCPTATATPRPPKLTVTVTPTAPPRTATPTTSPQPPPPSFTPTPCTTGWRRLNSPDTAPSGGNMIEDIAVVAPNDAWAVGHNYFWSNNDPLTLHWNGIDWQFAQGPPVGSNASPYSISAAAGEVWMAGRACSTGPCLPFTARYDGSAWQLVPLPLLPTYTRLDSIAVRSATDVWAVGDGGILHWDGSAWQPSHTPVNGRLYNIVVAGPVEVWASGDRDLGSGLHRALLAHWDGNAWTEQLGPDSGQGDLSAGLSADASNDVWALGAYYASGANTPRPLVARYDGTTWTAVSSPALGPGPFNDLAVQSPTNVWLVGDTTAHWDGTAWTLVPPPYPALKTAAFLYPDVLLAGGVGTFAGYRRTNTLALRYTPFCPSLTPTPASSRTPSATPSP